MTDKTNEFRFGPVVKSQYIRHAIKHHELSAKEMAALFVIADKVNNETGVCYFSHQYLADEINTTERHTYKALKRLSELGLIVQLDSGYKGRANTYSLNNALLLEVGHKKNPVLQDMVSLENTLSARTPCPVGHPVLEEKIPCPTGHETLSYRTDQSINQFEHQARIDAAAPGRAGGPTGSRQIEQRYPAFWEAYGKADNVEWAEKNIDKAINDGATIQEIIDGANRFRMYVEATGGKYKSAAHSWIGNKRWRDEWKLPKSKLDSSIDFEWLSQQDDWIVKSHSPLVVVDADNDCLIVQIDYINWLYKYDKECKKLESQYDDKEVDRLIDQWMDANPRPLHDYVINDKHTI